MTHPLIEETLRLDREATTGPWLYMNSDGDVHPIGTTSDSYACNHGIGAVGDTSPSVLGCDEYHIFGDNTADVELILTYRTAAPKLARALEVALTEFQRIYENDALPEAKDAITEIETILNEGEPE